MLKCVVVFAANVNSHQIPYHAIPSIIAINMILAGASGGLLAVIIAVCAQVNNPSHMCHLYSCFRYDLQRSPSMLMRLLMACYHLLLQLLLDAPL